MYSQLRSFTLIALAAAVNAAPASSTSGPDTISVALHPDTQCNILAGGYPSSLDNGVCYNFTSAAQSFEFYIPPSNYGSLDIFPTADCCGEDGASYSLLKLGCSAFGFEAYSVRYNKD